MEICNSLSLVPRSHPAFRRCSTEKRFGIRVWGEPGTRLQFSPILSFLCSYREREEKKAKRKKGSGMLSFNMDEEDEENGEECKC